MATPILTAYSDEWVYISHGMISYVDAFSLDGILAWSLSVDDQVFRQMDFAGVAPAGASMINNDIGVDDDGRVYLAKAL